MSDSPVVLTPDQANTNIRPNRRRGDIIFTIGVLVLLAVAWYVRRELVIIYVSALFAVVLMPVLNGIMKLRIGKWSPGRSSAVAILLLAVVAAISLFCLFAIPPVVHDLHDFAVQMPTRGPQELSHIRKLPFMEHVNLDAIDAKIRDFASNLATFVFRSIGSWAGTVFDIVIGVILLVYFMLEGEIAYFWILSFFPADKRRRLDSALGRAEIRMGRWLLGQGTLMLILGTSSIIVFRLLHIRYAYALGVLMGLFNLVPVVGALISVSLSLLVAAIDSWGRVLGVLIFYAIYAQVENSYLTPRIMQSTVDLAGLAVIIALLLGSALAGVVGAMVSVPTAVLVAVLLNEYLVQSEPVITPGGTAVEVPAVKAD
ncbi:MAG TPA: AI-2E family transporter [Silvibacterium sp.]|nr:AI-2E family transporter [Silvibacterium sp.]